MAEGRIMIVEDEALVADFLAEVLVDRGYEVVAIADNGKDAIAHAQTLLPDLVLMDIEIRGPMDGIQVAAKLKGAVPIIFLTAYKDDETVLMAVDQKPSAYLIKPVTEAELLATVAVTFKNHTPSRSLAPPQALPALPYRYCKESGLLYEAGDIIPLSRLERRLAGLLFAQAGQVVNQGSILAVCWPEALVSDSSVRNLVFKLRRKVPLVQIEVIKDLGYRLAPIYERAGGES